jgi:hypothetical protein
LKWRINKNELTKEMVMKAMQCETEEELIALAIRWNLNLSTAK